MAIIPEGSSRTASAGCSPWRRLSWGSTDSDVVLPPGARVSAAVLPPGMHLQALLLMVSPLGVPPSGGPQCTPSMGAMREQPSWQGRGSPPFPPRGKERASPPPSPGGGFICCLPGLKNQPRLISSKTVLNALSGVGTSPLSWGGCYLLIPPPLIMGEGRCTSSPLLGGCNSCYPCAN